MARKPPVKSLFDHNNFYRLMSDTISIVDHDKIVNELKSTLAAKESACQAHTSEIETLKASIEEYKATLTKKETDCQAHTAALEKAKTSVEELLDKSQKQAATILSFNKKHGVPKAAILSKTVKVDEKEYKFVLPKFRFDGQEILSEDAIHDEDLLRSIISLEGQGILKEIV